MLHWDDLRYFLAVAQAGSLSGAARALSVAQPTVGRRISAFERSLGAQCARFLSESFLRLRSALHPDSARRERAPTSAAARRAKGLR